MRWLIPSSFALILLLQLTETSKGFTLDEADDESNDIAPAPEGFNALDYDDDTGFQNYYQPMQKRYYSPNEFVKRRLCITPTMSCNLRPYACCPNTTCRCNLWGQNCRCLRMGFFQRWGKK